MTAVDDRVPWAHLFARARFCHEVAPKSHKASQLTPGLCPGGGRML